MLLPMVAGAIGGLPLGRCEALFRMPCFYVPSQRREAPKPIPSVRRPGGKVREN